MPREFNRSERMADAVQRDIAQIIRQELRDPRVHLVNITGVEVSRDLAQAKVYVNFVEEQDEPQARSAVDVLNGAAGFLRTQLAKTMRARTIPRLRFIFDNSGKRGQHLSALIDYAVARDRGRNTPSGNSGDG